MAVSDGKLSPWHMWGGEATAKLIGQALVSSTVQANQLAQVQYRRPDTWEFLLVAQLQSISAPSPVVIAVDFQLIVGVGRSTSSLNPFVRFEFPAAELVPGNPAIRFCTQVQAADPTATRFAPTAPNVIDHLPAQTISCNASVFSEGSINVGNTAVFQLAAYFAPRSHVRPDWYNGQFSGELEGR